MTNPERIRTENQNTGNMDEFEDQEKTEYEVSPSEYLAPRGLCLSQRRIFNFNFKQLRKQGQKFFLLVITN